MMGSNEMRQVARPGTVLAALTLLVGGALAGCAGTPPLPQTRSLITITGERVQADPEAMVEVDRWLRPQLDDIERNPGFLIRLLQEDRPVYPWQTLVISADTAQLSVQRGHGDAETPFLIYAHFRLMAERGELRRWLPEAFPEEASPAEGLDLERMMLRRIADLWLLGRSVFDTSPYGPLDELLFAHEAGFLDEFIFASQPGRFTSEAEAHFAANPERAEAFQRWFLRAFEAEGPRFVDEPEPDEAEPAPDPGQDAEPSDPVPPRVTPS